MKADAKPDRHDDGEPEPLRTLLRGWSVPAVPAEIEDALRQEFRRRRPRRTTAVWLVARRRPFCWPPGRSSLPGTGEGQRPRPCRR